MFTKDSGAYITPERTLKNMEKFLVLIKEQGWSEEELYFVVKLTLAMFGNE